MWYWKNAYLAEQLIVDASALSKNLSKVKHCRSSQFKEILKTTERENIK